VQIRSTLRIVEVFFNGERIACHVRNTDPRKRFITETSHMPDNHKEVSEWSPKRFISWAAKTGEHTKRYITALLNYKEHPEQAYRTCAGILRIAAKVTVEQMEAACAEALVCNIYSYTYFTQLLESLTLAQPVTHENIRGKDYFKGDGHVE
jgi:hypothetical protein